MSKMFPDGAGGFVRVSCRKGVGVVLLASALVRIIFIGRIGTGDRAEADAGDQFFTLIWDIIYNREGTI